MGLTKAVLDLTAWDVSNLGEASWEQQSVDLEVPEGREGKEFQRLVDAGL